MKPHLRSLRCSYRTAFNCFIGLVVLFAVTPLWASCLQVFPGGAQNHSPGGNIRLQPRATITGSGSQLNSNNVSAPGGFTSCVTDTCAANNSPTTSVSVQIQATSGANGAISGTGGSFPAGNYTTVDLNNDASLTFTTSGGSYRTGNFIARDRARIYFAPGDYWINGNLTFTNDVRLFTTGTGAVRIFVSGAISAGDRFETVTPTSANLLLFAKGNISFGQDARVLGFLYSETGGVTLNERGVITGGISAAAQIYLNNDATLNYSRTAAANADFGALCSLVTAPAFSNWLINVGGGNASTCAPYSVTISARDSNNNLLTNFTGTVNLSTTNNRGNWGKTPDPTLAFGPLTPGPANSGAATYRFAADGSDQGQITLRLANSQAQTLRVRASEPDTGINTLSNPITFAENAFVITSIDPLAEDLIAGRPHALQARMLRRDPTSGECGPAPEYQNNQVELWLSRTNADPGGAAPTLTASGGSVIPPNSAPGNNNFNLAFSAGVANFSLLASDVGQYALNLRDNNQNFSDLAIVGGSPTFVARPFGFAIEVLNNPAANNANGPVFRAAGDMFSVRVRAVGWQAADDSNNDGQPDGHQDLTPDNRANLQDNPTLLSFARETPPTQVRLNARLLLPTEGLDPGLANGCTGGADARLLSSFNNGVASTHEVYYPEVGIVQISARLEGENYLGIGSNRASRSNSTSGRVGRFSPGYFEVIPGQVQASCTQLLPYSYMEQPFTVEWALAARNSQGHITANYQGDFNKLDPEQDHILMRAIDQAEPTPLNERIRHDSLLTWENGWAEVVSETILARGAQLDGPFVELNLGVRLSDADNITLREADLNLNTEADSNEDSTLDALRLGQTEMRFGRLRLADAFGPETANLPVTLQSEYWRENHWQQNPDDDCTTLALSAIAYNGQSLADPNNRTVSIGGGNTTGEYADINATRIRLQGGDAGHFFTAPGAGNTGALTVDINLVDYSWLRFDWNADGNFDNPVLPTAAFTFGTYRGHDRILYWRELLE